MNPPTDKDSWTVTTWGDVRSFSTIEATLAEVKEALELGSDRVGVRLVRAPAARNKGVMVESIDRCANRACAFNTKLGICSAQSGECFGYVEPPKAEQPT